MTDTDSAPLAADPLSLPTSRRGLLAGAGLLAAAAGTGLAWWQSREPAAALGAEPFDGFWKLQWATPQGASLAMQSFRGQPLLINFWATWCPPCIEELPLINRFFEKNKDKGWQVLGLAIDQPSAVAAFLNKMPLGFPVGLAGADGSALAGQLGNPSGSLPFSVVLGSGGTILQRKLGRLTSGDLDLWAQLK